MPKLINSFITGYPNFGKVMLSLIIILALIPVDSYFAKLSKALSMAVYATVETTSTVHTGDSADDSAI